MPEGFSLLDAALVSIPIGLALLGLIRGAPVELASWLGCMAGVAACWLVSQAAALQALGQPGAPLAALVAGIVVWRVVCALSERLGLAAWWVDLGGVFDSAAGCAMGAARGVAVAAGGCLACAAIAVPLGFEIPLQGGVFSLFLAVGSRVTSAALAAPRTEAAIPGSAVAASSLASVPLPVITGDGGQAPSGHMPNASSMPAGPTRDAPISAIEAHHNILHPTGLPAHRDHR